MFRLPTKAIYIVVELIFFSWSATWRCPYRGTPRQLDHFVVITLHPASATTYLMKYFSVGFKPWMNCWENVSVGPHSIKSFGPCAVIFSHEYTKQIYCIFWSKVLFDPDRDWTQGLSILIRPLCYLNCCALVSFITQMFMLKNFHLFLGLGKRTMWVRAGNARSHK